MDFISESVLNCMESQQIPPTISNNDVLTSLAGILFFGPFMGTSYAKESFVYQYCNVWKFNLILFIITFLFSITNYAMQSTVLYRLSIVTSLIICVISTFCIVACINKIPLNAIMPELWPYPSLKDIALRPYTISKNLLHHIKTQWESETTSHPA